MLVTLSTMSYPCYSLQHNGHTRSKRFVLRCNMNDCLRRKIHRVPEPHNGVYCSLNERLSETIEELVSTLQQNMPANNNNTNNDKHSEGVYTTL